MADPLSGAAAAGGAMNPWGALAGGLAGGIGGMLQGAQADRRGYGKATKQRKLGLGLFGLGDYGAINTLQGQVGNRALTAEDFAKAGIDPSTSSYAQMVLKGGMPGIRSDYQKKFLENLEGGFAGAEEAITGAAGQSRESVLGEREKAKADTTTSLQQAGLASSNIAQQARANVSYQAGRALSEIDTQLGSALSDLRLSKSQAMDSVLARNLGLDEQTFGELMGFLVGPSGYGPNASSQFFSGQGGGFTSSGVDMTDVGAGLSDIIKSLGDIFGKK